MKTRNDVVCRCGDNIFRDRGMAAEHDVRRVIADEAEPSSTECHRNRSTLARLARQYSMHYPGRPSFSLL